MIEQEPITVLVAARDEEDRIAGTVRRLRERFPHLRLIVADDGSRDATVARARASGAEVLELPRRGKAQALSAAERVAPPGGLLLVDVDVYADVDVSLLLGGQGMRAARFVRRQGGGFGVAKRVAAALIRFRTGVEVVEPLSGQRALDTAARAAVFPLAPGFGA